MRTLRRTLFTVCLAALLAACPSGEEEEPVCAPGETQRCACPGDEDGVQACREDRSGWAPCECPDRTDAGASDAGTGNDTGAADAGTDDVGTDDAGATDAGAIDAGSDAAAPDTGPPDSGDTDGGIPLWPIWVSIPGGTFEMGCSPDDNLCEYDELPRHTVSISAFEMTATEITQAQFEAITGMNWSYHTDCPTCPVEQIDWAHARDYCEDIGGRLPTEAEWEYAARAGSTTRYVCGDEEDCLESVAWLEPDSLTSSHPVGEMLANDFGLYDMLGNVWEWTADGYQDDYYAVSAEQDPVGPRTSSDSPRVARGGSFSDWPNAVRVSERRRSYPELGFEYDGVRCAR